MKMSILATVGLATSAAGLITNGDAAIRRGGDLSQPPEEQPWIYYCTGVDYEGTCYNSTAPWNTCTNFVEETMVGLKSIKTNFFADIFFMIMCYGQMGDVYIEGDNPNLPGNELYERVTFQSWYAVWDWQHGGWPTTTTGEWPEPTEATY